jgi:hypothetical protein
MCLSKRLDDILYGLLCYLKIAKGEYSQQDDDDNGADETTGYLFHNEDACYDSNQAK